MCEEQAGSYQGIGVSVLSISYSISAGAVISASMWQVGRFPVFFLMSGPGLSGGVTVPHFLQAVPARGKKRVSGLHLDVTDCCQWVDLTLLFSLKALFYP